MRSGKQPASSPQATPVQQRKVSSQARVGEITHTLREGQEPGKMKREGNHRRCQRVSQKNRLTNSERGRSVSGSGFCLKSKFCDAEERSADGNGWRDDDRPPFPQRERQKSAGQLLQTASICATCECCAGTRGHTVRWLTQGWGEAWRGRP